MRVLVLGAGGPAANSFARSLRLAKGYHIIGANSSEDDLLLAEADETHLLPPLGEGLDSDLALFDLVGKTQPDFIHSQPDQGVEVLSALRERLGLAFTFLPPHEHIEVCQDKYLSYLIWREAGVPVPRTATGWSEFQWPRAARLHVRPRTGAGGKDSLRDATRELAIQWLLNKKNPRAYTVAESLPGPTVTWQGIYKDGSLTCSQLRTRLAWTDGERGSARISETYSNPNHALLAMGAVTALGGTPNGIYGVDFTLDADGEPRVTEINIGRFFTTIEFFARCGLNMPDFYVQRCPESHPAFGKMNPLDGQKWVRAMDVSPVLVA